MSRIAPATNGNDETVVRNQYGMAKQRYCTVAGGTEKDHSDAVISSLVHPNPIAACSIV